MKNKKGFTLIEILVAILIIGILAAVAIPKYNKAVEQSYSAEALLTLKAVSDAAKSYYVNKGEEFSSFDMLEIDIPWPKSTRVIGSPKDTRANERWALEVENVRTGNCIFMTRISGKYKGAGFKTCDYTTNYKIACQERIAGTTTPFNPTLKHGAYCEDIMHWHFTNESVWSRTYWP